jgi:predicted DNA-binding transcriptional regulator AlpA
LVGWWNFVLVVRGPQVDKQPATMEILTADEVAAWLKISKWQVYELAKARTRSGDVREHPLPVLRIGSSVRFRKSDLEEWIEKLRGKVG